jgi:hypothetical protein
LLRRRVLMLRFRSELGSRVRTAMATRVMDMGIIRMGIIDRIHTTATATMGGLHPTGPAGIESITATGVIRTAIGTKLTYRIEGD